MGIENSVKLISKSLRYLRSMRKNQLRVFPLCGCACCSLLAQSILLLFNALRHPRSMRKNQ